VFEANHEVGLKALLLLFAIRLADAWAVGVLLKNKDLWSSLAKRALELYVPVVACLWWRACADVRTVCK